MSNFFQSQSRRKFLKVADASALSSVFLKGCLGNPPDPNAGTETTPAPAAPAPAANVNPAQVPFVNTIKLGFIPIVESAAMVIAKEKGFFATSGMTVETMRWGFHENDFKDFDQVQALVNQVNREDIWREAATVAGFTADIPAQTSRGVERFSDRIEFDPANPQAYLDSLLIKA